MASVIAARPLVAEWTTHHRVPLPRLARLLVANPAPEVDDLLAVKVGAAGAAQLAPSGEVLGERLAHRLKATTDVSLYRV